MRVKIVEVKLNVYFPVGYEAERTQRANRSRPRVIITPRHTQVPFTPTTVKLQTRLQRAEQKMEGQSL